MGRGEGMRGGKKIEEGEVVEGGERMVRVIDDWEKWVIGK